VVYNLFGAGLAQRGVPNKKGDHLGVRQDSAHIFCLSFLRWKRRPQ
jgi:hypothetical protein